MALLGSLCYYSLYGVTFVLARQYVELCCCAHPPFFEKPISIANSIPTRDRAYSQLTKFPQGIGFQGKQATISVPHFLRQTTINIFESIFPWHRRCLFPSHPVQHPSSTKTKTVLLLLPGYAGSESFCFARDRALIQMPIARTTTPRNGGVDEMRWCDVCQPFCLVPLLKMRLCLNESWCCALMRTRQF